MTESKTTNWLRRIIMGIGYLEGYGNHPGIGVFIGITAISFLVGWQCGVANFIVWGIALCVGAYGRAQDYERRLHRE